MSHPNISIRPATAADIPRIVEVQLAAFDPMELMEYVHPYRHAYPATYARSVGLIMRGNLANPTYHCFVAVDETTDEPLAYALWTESADASTPQGWKQRFPAWYALERALLKVESYYTDKCLNRWSAQPAIRSFFAQTTDILKGWGQPHLYLKHLCVMPGQQGRGIGGLMVRHGLSAARQTDLCASLVSTSGNADRMYSREGFRQIGEVISERDGRQTKCSAMVWEPDVKAADT